MGKPHKEYSCGDKVFAKVRGYPPWPARIKEVIATSKQLRYHVFFYGTYERGIVKPEDIFEYEENREKLGASQKRRFFNEGMREIEENPDIEPSFEFSPLKKYSPKVIKSTAKIKEEPDENTKPLLDDRFKLKQLDLSESPERSMGKKTKKITLSLKKTSPLMETEPIQISRSGRKIKPKKFDDFAELQPGKSQKFLEQGSEQYPEVADAKLESHEEDSSEDNVQECKSSYLSDVSSKLSSPSSEAGSESEKDDKSTYKHKLEAKHLKKRSQTDSHKVKSQKLDPTRSKVIGQEIVKKKKNLIPPNKLPRERHLSKGKEILDPDMVKNIPRENKGITRELNKCTESDTGIPKAKPVKLIEKYQPKYLTVIAKSGVMVDILYNENKPKSFESHEAKEKWEISTAGKLMQCKADLESGKYVPPELESLLAVANTVTDGDLEAKEIKESISWLKQEAVVLKTTHNIVQSLPLDRDPDIPRCLVSLDDLLNISIDPFMLVKNPEAVLVIKECTCYFKIPCIQEKALHVYDRFKILFDASDDRSFYENYSARRKEFSRLTKGLSRDKRQSLTQLPVKEIDDSDDSDSQDLVKSRPFVNSNSEEVGLNKDHASGSVV